MVAIPSRASVDTFLKGLEQFHQTHTEGYEGLLWETGQTKKFILTHLNRDLDAQRLAERQPGMGLPELMQGSVTSLGPEELWRYHREFHRMDREARTTSPLARLVDDYIEKIFSGLNIKKEPETTVFAKVEIRNVEDGDTQTIQGLDGLRWVMRDAIIDTWETILFNEFVTVLPREELEKRQGQGWILEGEPYCKNSGEAAGLCAAFVRSPNHKINSQSEQYLKPFGRQWKHRFWKNSKVLEISRALSIYRGELAKYFKEDLIQWVREKKGEFHYSTSYWVSQDRKHEGLDLFDIYGRLLGYLWIGRPGEKPQETTLIQEYLQQRLAAWASSPKVKKLYGATSTQVASICGLSEIETSGLTEDAIRAFQEAIKPLNPEAGFSAAKANELARTWQGHATFKEMPPDRRYGGNVNLLLNHLGLAIPLPAFPTTRSRAAKFLVDQAKKEKNGFWGESRFFVEAFE